MTSDQIDAITATEHQRMYELAHYSKEGEIDFWEHVGKLGDVSEMALWACVGHLAEPTTLDDAIRCHDAGFDDREGSLAACGHKHTSEAAVAFVVCYAHAVFQATLDRSPRPDPVQFSKDWRARHEAQTAF